MKGSRRSKIILFGSLGLSLFGLVVASISTFAWFQLETNPANPSFITSTPSIEINDANVKGYKKTQSLSDLGMPQVSEVEEVTGTSSSAPKTNEDAEGSDLNFDVPSDGYGFYLIKHSAGGYVANYNGINYASKLTEYNSTGGVITQTRIDGFTVTTGDMFKIMHYYVDTVGGTRKTTYNNVSISNKYPDTAEYCTISSNIITITTTGTFNVWVDHNTNRSIVGFEAVQDAIANINRPARKNSVKMSPKTNPYTLYVVSGNSNWTTWNNRFVVGDGSSWSSASTSPRDTDFTVGDSSNFNKAKIGSTEYNFQSISVSLSNSSNWLTVQKYNADGSSFEADGYVDESQQYFSSAGDVIDGDNNVIYVKEYSGRPWLNEPWKISGWHYKVKLVSGNDSSILGCSLQVAGTYSPGTPTAPTGYSFENWYTESTFDNVYSGSITADTTLYAKFVSIAPSNVTFKTYLYDALGTTASPTWATPKVYAWGDSASVYPENQVYTYTARHEHLGHYYYEFDISISYTGFDFRNGDSSGNGNQTIDLTQAGGTDKYFVMNDTNYGGWYKGGWYSALASTNTNTYYYYDNRATGKWSNPKAYLWTDGSVYPSVLQAWDGVAMTQISAATASSLGVIQENTWEITASESYDKIVFNSGGEGINSNRTNDLTTTGNDGRIAVLTDQSNDGKWNAEWFDGIKSIRFKAVYFIDGNKMSISDGASSYVNTVDTTPVFTSYEPESRIYSALYNNERTRDYVDSAKGIYYTFALDGANSQAKIYLDENCTTELTSGDDISDNVTGEIAVLYLKFTTSSSDYITFYTETWNAVTEGVGGTLWTGVWYCNTDGKRLIQMKQVGTYLFKVTVPVGWSFSASNGVEETSTGSNRTVTTSVPASAGEKPILHIYQSANGTEHTVTWGTSKGDQGTAEIQLSDDGTVWSTVQEMQIGDMSINYYIYEHALAIPVGKYVRIRVSGSDAPSVFSNNYTDDEYLLEYSSYNNPSGTPYITQDGSHIKMANYNGTVRFNFYVSNVDSTVKFSMAMLPNQGNGYYIIPYNSSYGTNTYSGAIKMETGDGAIKATYDDFYAAANSRFFIKSYIDLVETDDYSLATSSLYFVSVPHESDNSVPEIVFEFASPAHYSISISSEGEITISKIGGNSSFLLNELDLNHKSTRAEIKNQCTSLILEIPFDYLNDYSSNISLKVANNLSSFVGVALYVSSSRLGSTCYATLHDNNSYYNSLSSSSLISDLSNRALSSSGKYYAYILIDYLPTEVDGVSYSSFANNASLRQNISFYLQANQVA